jgi:tetraacyldisaccharide 4'-kinase
MNPILRGAGVLYRGINRMRRALYQRDVLRAKRLPRPVVSVGNITVGGAGKTPAVIAIGRHLIESGYRVAILTRGYGRSGQEQGLMWAPDAARWGDEPSLIKTRLDKADVIVGPNRYENAVVYLGQNDTDIFILDDGFQHLQLHRDLDVVIDSGRTAVPSREGRDALEAASVIIPRNLRLDVPSTLRGQSLYAFAGLANPGQFFESLRAAGLTLAGTRAFPDHHPYSDRDLDEIAARAAQAGATAIVTTEKDAVKIPRRDIIPIRAEFVIEPSVLDRITALIQR